jgi:hypothetical protein
MADDSHDENARRAKQASLAALWGGHEAQFGQHSESTAVTPKTTLEAMLAAFATNIRDRYYKGQTIRLDGYTFTNCCFHNCILITETGLFSIHSCTFANSTVQFGSSAQRIIRLFGLYHKSPWDLFNPNVAADGSVTID